MLIIPFRVLMRLKLNEIMHVKCFVEYLAFIKCAINASGSDSDIQVPVCRRRLCVWVSTYALSLVHLFLGHEERFLYWL